MAYLVYSNTPKDGLHVEGCFTDEETIDRIYNQLGFKREQTSILDEEGKLVYHIIQIDIIGEISYSGTVKLGSWKGA